MHFSRTTSGHSPDPIDPPDLFPPRVYMDMEGLPLLPPFPLPGPRTSTVMSSTDSESPHRWRFFSRNGPPTSRHGITLHLQQSQIKEQQDHF